MTWCLYTANFMSDNNPDLHGICKSENKKG